jgi:AraC-like DNA-binding protein
LILVRNYIANHYHEDLQSKDLEAVSGLSKNYLTNKFRITFGMTPFEYMVWTRMEKAKELAIHSNMSISEIANLVGYADVHTFGKMFKKKTGVSLSQFCASLVTLL